MSYAWWLVEPVLETAVFYLVFGVFMGDGSLDFLVFLLCGLVPWTWFSRSVTNSMMSLKGGAWLITNTRVHPLFLTFVELGADASKQAVTFCFLAAVLLIIGQEISGAWVWLPFLIALQFSLVGALGCFVATLVALLEDFKHVIGTMLLLVMFVSGIFYRPEELISAEFQSLFFLNPVAALVDSYRQVLLSQQAPELHKILVVVCWGFLIATVTFAIHRRLKYQFARIISQ